ncbi:type II CAAX endopeptidase family protein [Schleiferiaceae bacterium]|nr:type II CAAX endopeptidase family protein [Schleiferiaceae bacterium]
MSHANKELWSPLRTGMAFLMVVLISTTVFTGVGLLITGTEALNGTDANALRLLQFFNSIGLFLIPPIFLAFWVSTKPWSFLGLQSPRLPSQRLLIGLTLVAIGSFFVIDLLSQFNTLLLPDAPWVHSLEIQEAKVELALARLLSNMTLQILLLNAIVMVAAPAFGEEFFFRGVLQRLFTEKWSHHGAILLTAICFGLVHMQPLSLLPILFMGIIFGYIKHWTGTLWAPIALHFINNGFALGTAYLNKGQLLTESALNGTLWTALGSLALASGLWLLSTLRPA